VGLAPLDPPYNSTVYYNSPVFVGWVERSETHRGGISALSRS
jgi:hypothetical protein